MNIAFFPSLWRTSRLEQLLENQTEFTLELLDQDDILEETRFNNEKLIRILATPTAISQLLDQMLDGPHNLGNNPSRYPTISCEILNFGVAAVNQTIFENHFLLDRLFSFLEKPSPLNPINALYFCKICVMLIEHQKQSLFAYLKTKEGLVSKFIEHLSTASITELILAMIKADQIDPTGFIKWLSDEHFMSKVLVKLDQPELAQNITQILLDITALSSYPSPLVEQLDNEIAIERLLKDAITGQPTVSVLGIDGLDVIVGLLHWYNTNAPIIAQETLITLTDVVNSDNVLGNKPIMIVIDKHIDIIFKHLITQGTVPNATGKIPFGHFRLKLLHFFVAFLATANYQKSIHKTFLRLNISGAALDIFFKYEWNNFVHHQVKDLLLLIFDSCNPELLEQLFTQNQLLKRIMDAYDGVPKGYCGHLAKLGPEMSTFAILSKYIDNDIWREFASNKLNPVLDIHPEPISFADTNVESGFILENDEGEENLAPIEPQLAP